MNIQLSVYLCCPSTASGKDVLFFFLSCLLVCSKTDLLVPEGGKTRDRVCSMTVRQQQCDCTRRTAAMGMLCDKMFVTTETHHEDIVWTSYQFNIIYTFIYIIISPENVVSQIAASISCLQLYTVTKQGMQSIRTTKETSKGCSCQAML